jgi:hypothetical protein
MTIKEFMVTNHNHFQKVAQQEKDMKEVNQFVNIFFAFLKYSFILGVGVTLMEWVLKTVYIGVFNTFQ